MKTILIFGAGSVGIAVGKTYLEQGYRVALCDSRTDVLAKAQKALVQAAIIPVENPADPTQITKIADDAAETLGGLDVYAHTLTYDDFVPFSEMGWEDYRKVRSINLDLPFLWGQIVGKKMAELGNGGEIIYTLSDACTGQEPEEVARCATHWAAKGLIRSMAVVLGHKGIAVNAVCPGALNTPEEKEKWAKIAAFRGVTTRKLLAEKKARSLTGTLQTAEDVAALHSFLTDEAINISGQALLLNGGAAFN